MLHMNLRAWHLELTQHIAFITIIIQDGEMNGFLDKHLFYLFLICVRGASMNKCLNLIIEHQKRAIDSYYERTY